jgi:ribosomal protein S18 acetylase RimI-like enzyme
VTAVGDDRAVHASIRYQAGCEGIETVHLQGFFDGWPDPPTSATHLRILRGSSVVVLAVDADTGRVVGFVTALSDGVTAAYLPLLEVLPAYRGRGIGSELVRRVLRALGDLYMVDVACDADVVPFYRRLGFRPATGAGLRRHARQAGVPDR